MEQSICSRCSQSRKLGQIYIQHLEYESRQSQKTRTATSSASFARSTWQASILSCSISAGGESKTVTYLNRNKSWENCLCWLKTLVETNFKDYFLQLFNFAGERLQNPATFSVKTTLWHLTLHWCLCLLELSPQWALISALHQPGANSFPVRLQCMICSNVFLIAVIQMRQH